MSWSSVQTCAMSQLCCVVFTDGVLALVWGVLSVLERAVRMDRCLVRSLVMRAVRLVTSISYFVTAKC